MRLQGERFWVPTGKGWAVAQAEKARRVLVARVLEHAAERYRSAGRRDLDLVDRVSWALYASPGGIEDLEIPQAEAVCVCEAAWAILDDVIAGGVYAVPEMLGIAASCARSDVGE